MRGGEIQLGHGPVGWKSEQTGDIYQRISLAQSHLLPKRLTAAVWGDNHGNGAYALQVSDAARLHRRTM